MTEREDERFEVVDKRKSREAESEGGEGAEAKADEEASAAAEGGVTTEEVEAGGAPAESPTVYALLAWMVGLLYQQAWLSMGLVADPVTKQVSRDMAQARVAIDCVEFIVKQLEGHVEPEDLRELRNALSNLQVNFVTHSG